MEEIELFSLSETFCMAELTECEEKVLKIIDMHEKEPSALGQLIMNYTDVTDMEEQPSCSHALKRDREGSASSLVADVKRNKKDSFAPGDANSAASITDQLSTFSEGSLTSEKADDRNETNVSLDSSETSAGFKVEAQKEPKCVKAESKNDSGPDEEKEEDSGDDEVELDDAKKPSSKSKKDKVGNAGTSSEDKPSTSKQSSKEKPKRSHKKKSKGDKEGQKPSAGKSKSGSEDENDSSDEDSNALNKANYVERRKEYLEKRNLQQKKRRSKFSEATKNTMRKKAREGMKKYRERISDAKKTERRELDRERRRLSRICKKIGMRPCNDENGLDIFQNNFDCFMASLTLITCSKCKKKRMKSCYDKSRCKDCHLFTKENGMDPGELPEELSGLSFVEQQLIAKVHPVVSVYRIKRGEQFKYSGQVINFPQNVQEVCDVLPPTVSSMKSILTVRVQNSDGYKDFQVRREKVRNALVWLKNNNPFYADIVINEENLASLPLDGNVYCETNGYDVDVSSDLAPLDLEGVHYVNYSELEDGELDGIDFKHVPDIANITQKEKIGHSLNDSVLLWPSIGATPVNEFGSPGYITMAFPHLFPYGEADYSNRENNQISLSKYIQHLMLFHDDRFAKDPRFRFFMMNSQMRWQALNVGNIYVKKNKFFSDFTVVQLKAYLKLHPELLSNIMFYSSRLRSTKAYWKSRCSELLDMVKHLGAPTIFFTLSSADYHWKDLFRLLGVDDPSTLSIPEKTKLLSENPLLVSTFFKIRCEHFLHKCLFKRFDVVDYWYRVEYQHRGSCHVHGVIWIKDAPDVRNISTDEDKQKVKEFFDKLVSCQNPDLSFTPNLIHPCERSASDCPNLDDDLAELVNRVQRHTKCSSSYCLRKDKHTGQTSCRFGFPKELREETELVLEKGEMQINFRCNDMLLNKYNPWVLQTWRSNIDFTAIVSEDILYRYIAKYASKCEIKSGTYDDLLQNILNSNTGDNLSCKKIIRKLIISTCAERDYSAQEVMFILMSYPLFHSSRQFVILNLKESVWETVSNSDSSKKLVFIEHYMKRPAFLDETSLLDCAKLYYVRKGKWVKRKKSAVVRVFPREFLTLDCEYTELRNLCILNVPWRDVSQFDITAEELQCELSKIGFDWHFEDVNDIYFEWSESENDGESENVESEVDSDDWSLISKIKRKPMGKNRDEITSDKYAWDYACNKYDLNELHNISKEMETVNVSKELGNFDYSKLSHDQLAAFKHFTDLIDGWQLNGVWCKERLLFVQGRAGYGKSFLLNAMRTYCIDKLGDGSCAVVAYSGVAAKNVDGETINSFFRIPPKSQFFQDLSTDNLRIYQDKHSNLVVIFIDEYSMVGLRLFGMLEQRCREAKDDSNSFGNLCVVLLGDVNQLGPMFDDPLYSEEVLPGSTSFAQRGKLMLTMFEKCFFLNIPMRFDDNYYVEFLERVASGTCTKADSAMLKKRNLLLVRESEKMKFKDCLRICAMKDASEECNNSRLSDLQNPIAKICAENNCSRAFNSGDRLAHGLTNVIVLAIGCRVMLRKNINVSLGLVNGILGNLVDLVYPKNCGPPQLPLFAIVKFDGCEGFSNLGGFVPVKVAQASWYCGRTRCTRAQLPLSLSWACTIHKSQSLTLPKAEVDLGHVEFEAGLTYVALSRVKNDSDLLLVENVPLSRLNCIRKSKQFHLRMKFLEWLKTLSSE